MQIPMSILLIRILFTKYRFINILIYFAYIVVIDAFEIK